MIDKRYKCAFCGKDFQRKSWYDKHECEQKKRFNQVHNMDVILGFKLFAHWCQRNGFQRRNKPRQMPEFLKSPFYETFIKLVAFSHENYLISPFVYLDWIIDCSIPERDWTAAKTLASYRRHVRQTDNPQKHVETSVKAVVKWCEENSIHPVHRFFTEVPTVEALKMMITNQLMPWVVFGYDYAVQQLLSRFDDEKLTILQEKINAEHWIKKVEEQPDEARVVDELCRNTFGV